MGRTEGIAYYRVDDGMLIASSTLMTTEGTSQVFGKTATAKGSTTTEIVRR